LPYHQAVLKDELPFTIGGGIGQSRLCMMLLGKVHIGEVQASLWSKDILDECRQKNIPLL
jgi:aspartate--ammonia ligase